MLLIANAELVDCIGVRSSHQLHMVQCHQDSVDHAILICHDLALIESVDLDHMTVEWVLGFRLNIINLNRVKSAHVNLSELVKDLLVCLEHHDLIVKVRGNRHTSLAEVISREEQ